MLFAYSTGLMLSLSLILAIGSQNAFVLRQGILRQHVLPIVLFCAVADTILITTGVFANWSMAIRWSGSLAFRVWGAACSRPI